MRITVFGGSQPKPGDPAYNEALELGRLLGQAGHTVLTGGYIGTMEAVSRGAYETGGHVIGVTCDEIESWRPVKPNAWLHSELRHATLRARLLALIDECDAALALSGGAGTLAEVAMMWNQVLTAAVPPRPLVLVGPGWSAVLNAFYDAFGVYIPEPQRRWISLAPDIHAALAMLDGSAARG